MNRGQLPTKSLSDSNWGAFMHLMHPNYCQIISAQLHSKCVYVYYTQYVSPSYLYRILLCTEILRELRKFSTSEEKNQSIKRDLNPLHSVRHTRTPTTTPLLLSLQLSVIISPFHRQTLQSNPANHWQPIPKPPSPPLPSPSYPYRTYYYIIRASDCVKTTCQ